MTKILIRLAISLAIAGLLLWWLLSQGFDVVPELATIRETMDWWAIPGYAALFCAFHVLRAWRWTFLLRPFANVRSGVMLETALAGFLAIQMMPLRTGEVARPYLLYRYTGASKSAVFGTIAIERVVDGLLVSAWLTVALVTIPATSGPYVWTLRVLPLLVFAGALALLLAFHRWPVAVSRALARVLRVFSLRLAELVTGVIERFHDGLAALPDMRRFWAFVAFSAAYWGINAAAFFLLARGCGLALPVAGAVAGMGVLAVGILLPAGPGYFGNFQIAVLAALEMYLAKDAFGPEAAVFIFVLYVSQTGLTILFGALGALKLLGRPAVGRARAE